MKDKDIRNKFKEYFNNRGHKWYDSISLIPDDPSLLFTTAGMVQFKKQLLGDAGEITRAASIQISFLSWREVRLRSPLCPWRNSQQASC